MQTIYSLEHAEKTAAALRKEFDLAGPPDAEDLRRICQAKGIVLVEPGMLPEVDAIAASIAVTGFAVRSAGITAIFLRCLFDGREFDARTAFHELGHVLLGHLDGGCNSELLSHDWDLFNLLREPDELEANQFAEFLLSPAGDPAK